MRSRGFEHRQIRNINANKGTRYEGMIVGDSPEMCHALDCHGIADLKGTILAHASFISVYAVGDPHRFKLGTPDEAQRYRRLGCCATCKPQREKCHIS